MLQGTKINNYSISKLLTTSDYLCFDQSQNPYLLVPNESRQPTLSQDDILQFPNAIYRSDSVQEEQISYSCYHFLPQLQWIGDIHSLQFKSELFCLGILYSFISKVIKPIFDKSLNPYAWIHINNMWVNTKNNQLFLLLHNRQKSNKGVSTALYNQRQTLRKLSKILIPLFRINLQGNTFLSGLLKGMINCELSVNEIYGMLTDKKCRKHFMMTLKNMQNHPTIEQNILRKGLRMNTTTKQRRNLKFQKPSNRYGLREHLNVKKSVDNGLAPSFARKRNSISGMFHIDSIMKTALKSNSRKKQSLHIDRSLDMTKRSSLTPQRIYYCTNSKLKTISQTLKEKALKKYRDSVELDEQQNKANFKLKDQQFRKVFEIRRSSTISYKDSGRNQNKSVELDKKIETQKNTMNNLKKQLFETIDYSEKERKEEEKLLLNKKRQQQKLQQQIRMKELKRKEQQLQRRERYARQKQQILQKQRQQLQKLKQKELNNMKFNDQFNKKSLDQIQIPSTIQKQSKPIQKGTKKPKDTKQDTHKKQKKIEEDQTNLDNIPSLAPDSNYFKKAKSMAEMKNKNQQSKIDDESTVNIINLNLKNDKKKVEEKEKPIKKPPVIVPPQHQDEIQEIVLDTKKQKIPSPKKQLKSKPPSQSTIEGTLKKKNTLKEPQKKKEEEIDEIRERKKSEDKSHKRVNTNQSSVASSYGPKKSVNKIVNEYLLMVNKIGEGVAKSSRLDKKLNGVEWFIGVYFLYKRFLLERKRIQKWLQRGQAKLTRYGHIEPVEWEQWLGQEQRQKLHQKVKTENESIMTSIVKMNKKISKKPLKGNILYHAELKHNSPEQSKIAVSEIVKQYDQLEEKNLLKDQQIFTHISELINSLYILAQMDGKIKEKKPLIELVKVKRSPEELQKMVQFIYQLYIPSK